MVESRKSNRRARRFGTILPGSADLRVTSCHDEFSGSRVRSRNYWSVRHSSLLPRVLPECRATLVFAAARFAEHGARFRRRTARVRPLTLQRDVEASAVRDSGQEVGRGHSAQARVGGMQLVFDGLALGDIAQRADHRHGLLRVGIAHKLEGRLDPQIVSALVDHLVLDALVLTAVLHHLKRRAQIAMMMGMRGIKKR